MKTTTLQDYRYLAAGRAWLVPELTVIILPDGSEVLTAAEIKRVHRAIANEICGDPHPLTIEELDFLCDFTLTPLVEVADLLGVHKSTLSKWRSSGSIPRELYSTVLKKHFWFKLFGDEMSGKSIRLQQVENELDFLKFVHDEAIRERLAEPLERTAA